MIKANVENTKEIMMENLDKLLERGEKIDILVQKTNVMVKYFNLLWQHFHRYEEKCHYFTQTNVVEEQKDDYHACVVGNICNLANSFPHMWVFLQTLLKNNIN